MNPNAPMQTLVVHLDQLTPENMLQLSQAGYTILRDSNLLIFARPVPAQDQAASVASNGQLDEEVMDDSPVRLPNRSR